MGPEAWSLFHHSRHLHEIVSLAGIAPNEFVACLDGEAAVCAHALVTAIVQENDIAAANPAHYLFYDLPGRGRAPVIAARRPQDRFMAGGADGAQVRRTPAT